MIIINKSGTINKRVLRVPRVLRTGGEEACTNQCGWTCKAEQCGWMRKAERSGGLAGRSGGLAGRSGSAGRSGGLAEQQRWRSFAERRSFWVFPLHSPLLSLALVGFDTSFFQVLLIIKGATASSRSAVCFPGHGFARILFSYVITFSG